MYHSDDMDLAAGAGLLRPVVTLSRQMGSLGDEVAQMAAGLLGFRCVSREIINEAANLANTPGAALAEIDELGLLGFCPSPKECKAYREAIRSVITGLAEQGNVIIVGRAAQVILQDRPGAVHVRTIAPFEIRTARIAQIRHISIEAASAQVQATDRARQNYLRRFFHARWDDPQLYHLTINTSRVSPQSAAALIQQAVLIAAHAPPQSFGEEFNRGESKQGESKHP